MSTCLLITTCNRTPLLQHSMNRLVGLTLPTEVLIVDDGGDDGAEILCRQMSDRLPMRYLFHNNPGESLCSEARNVGIRHTNCEWIVTSEPEVLFDTDVIKQFQLAASGVHYGDVISAGTVHHARQTDGVDTIVGWVAPFAAHYKRDWLIEVGGWDEAFPSPWGWEDTDLLTRLRANGHGQFIDPSIHVHHRWHPPRHCEQGPNESHFRAKNLQHDTAHVVANRGREWGVLRP